MCGIAGFIGEGNQTILHTMTSALVHRGPDDEGYWHEPSNGVYLGHRRLSIIDIDSGQQPMRDASGDIIVIFNGEIYNHQELRTKLIARGYVFRTDHSDTEVLLQGYKEWGDALPEQLNGMWSFAIYDRSRRRLFLSRDRFGEKPLHYLPTPQGVFFGSEIKFIRELCGRRLPVNADQVLRFLVNGYKSLHKRDRTFFSGVREVPYACNLVSTLTASFFTS